MFFDTLGYSAADQLLVRVAAQVGVLPSDLVIARLMGDGFAILVNDGDAQSVATLAATLHESRQPPIAIRGLDMH